MKTVAIVLAAGKSSRMGSNKLLLKLNDVRVIDHILNRLEGIETIVVTGHRPEDIKGIIESRGVRAVHNPRYEEGMTTSFQAGLTALPNGVDAVFMVLSDTFGFKPSLLKEMIAIMESESALIVSPKHQGKRGHPVLFSKKVLVDFLSLEPGKTMKDVVNRYDDAHRYVQGDIWSITDLDTPEDYVKVKLLWSQRK